MGANLNKWDSVFACLTEVLIGILLLVNPIGFTEGIIIAFGIILCICGITNVIRYFRSDPAMAAVEQNFVKGLAFISIGLFCTFQAGWFIATFPVLTILYGAVVFFSGLYKTQRMVDMIRLDQRKWGWQAVNAVCSLVFGAVILFNPFSSTVFLWEFTGAALIVEAVFDAVTMIVSRKKGEI